MKNIPPVIKWSGSKRSQSEKIVALMPKEIDTYYEPFLGGGSVFIKLATSDKNVKRFVLSDLNDDLISLWKEIIVNEKEIYNHYKFHWEEMKSIKDWEKKKEYYLSIRERFNSKKSPMDFMFIMRTTFNGMPRYNKQGLFNNPLHPNRDGILPSKLLEIMTLWKKIISSLDVSFINQSFESVSSSEKDFIYLDPPYAGITGMYYGTLPDYNFLYDFLRSQKGKWALSFDGKTTSEDYSIKIPEDVYTSHRFLESGNSSFRRLNGKSNKEYVFESLYLNY